MKRLRRCSLPKRRWCPALKMLVLTGQFELSHKTVPSTKLLPNIWQCPALTEALCGPRTQLDAAHLDTRMKPPRRCTRQTGGSASATPRATASGPSAGPAPQLSLLGARCSAAAPTAAPQAGSGSPAVAPVKQYESESAAHSACTVLGHCSSIHHQSAPCTTDSSWQQRRPREVAPPGKSWTSRGERREAVHAHGSCLMNNLKHHVHMLHKWNALAQGMDTSFSFISMPIPGRKEAMLDLTIHPNLSPFPAQGQTSIDSPSQHTAAESPGQHRCCE